VDFFVPTDVMEIESVSTLERGAFDHEIGKRGDGPIVLFVHGYAYGFPRTCRVGAELQRMIGDDATIVMFSWPSDGNPADYVADRSDIEWSVPQLAGLIDDLMSSGAPTRLALLAHSMGARGVLAALDELSLADKPPPYADHLVLLAPDVDAARFRERYPRLERQVRQVTLYASSKDAPLLVSQTLNGHPRLGQAGDDLTVIDGMTTIDVSPLGRYHPSGHEYFFYHPIAAEDLIESLLHATPPERRRHARERTLDGKRYWVLVEPGSGITQ
jgi:esterase/lipase superfamily enzyme